MDTNKPKVFFILGGPGAGKGTQCAKLVQAGGYVHLSAGELLREERESASSEHGELIQKCMTEGRIVPVCGGERLCELRTERHHRQAVAQCNEEAGQQKVGKRHGGLCQIEDKNYLIDGFPRHQENWDVWQQEVGDQVNLVSMIFYECQLETLKARVIQRSKDSGRVDDNVETFLKRYQTYIDQTKPIIEYFRSIGKLIEVDASGTVEEVYASLMNQLEKIK